MSDDNYTVVGDGLGGHLVQAGGKTVSGPYPTQREAWRWIDDAQMEPKSRRDAVADFIWQRDLDRP